MCGRCGDERPPVCLECGASGFANLRPGVTRLREELEAAAGPTRRRRHRVRRRGPPEADIYVGTEAVLHRVDRADVVAFLDFDRELLAPRYRAGEQAMALLTKAARLLGRRERGGRLMVQTFLPQPRGDPSRRCSPTHPPGRRRARTPRAVRDASGEGARQRERSGERRGDRCSSARRTGSRSAGRSTTTSSGLTPGRPRPGDHRRGACRRGRAPGRRRPASGVIVPQPRSLVPRGRDNVTRLWAGSGRTGTVLYSARLRPARE